VVCRSDAAAFTLSGLVSQYQWDALRYCTSKARWRIILKLAFFSRITGRPHFKVILMECSDSALLCAAIFAHACSYGSGCNVG